MTKEEAVTFLPIKDIDDLDDLFEDKLFEMKQFLIGRFPVTKVIQGRLRKIDNITRSYEALGGKFDSFQAVPEMKVLSTTVKAVIDEFQSKRSQLKLRMMSSRNGYEVIEIAKMLILLTRSYVEKWASPNVNTQGVLLSTEPDPMELFSALKEFNEQGYVDFKSIDEFSEQNVLVREVKRLSLWQKMDSNE
ncbi:MAG: hypothetical protein MK066_10195 [Crocinitomicaceae bacterium]|nr:hypothetical protein [Crocinitomicaceae bacterium]